MECACALVPGAVTVSTRVESECVADVPVNFSKATVTVVLAVPPLYGAVGCQLERSLRKACQLAALRSARARLEDRMESLLLSCNALYSLEHAGLSGRTLSPLFRLARHWRGPSESRHGLRASAGALLL